MDTRNRRRQTGETFRCLRPFIRIFGVSTAIGKLIKTTRNNIPNKLKQN